MWVRKVGLQGDTDDCRVRNEYLYTPTTFRVFGWLSAYLDWHLVLSGYVCKISFLQTQPCELSNGRSGLVFSEWGLSFDIGCKGKEGGSRLPHPNQGPILRNYPASKNLKQKSWWCPFMTCMPFHLRSKVCSNKFYFITAFWKFWKV